MQTTNLILKHQDPNILAVIRPIIIDRAEDKGFIKPSDWTYGIIDDSCLDRYLNKFDYLDIMEIGMEFEKQYIEKTKKSFFIEEEDFDVLAKINHVGEFCYALHCCIEGKPIPHEPSKVEKLKTKFIQYKQSIKNSFTQILYNQKAQ